MPDTTRAKTKNVIDMALGFSAMNRAFKANSSKLIHRKLENVIGRLYKEDFENIHSSFCSWFMNTIKTTAGRRPSYGQAGKVLDVTLKVIVYYCHLPKASVAKKIVPLLHCAIDTPIMLHLKKKYHIGKGIFALSQVNKSVYKEFQSFAWQEAKEVGYFAVEYDDILWRKFNR